MIASANVAQMILSIAIRVRAWVRVCVRVWVRVTVRVAVRVTVRVRVSLSQCRLDDSFHRNVCGGEQTGLYSDTPRHFNCLGRVQGNAMITGDHRGRERQKHKGMV